MCSTTSTVRPSPGEDNYGRGGAVLTEAVARRVMEDAEMATVVEAVVAFGDALEGAALATVPIAGDVTVAR